MVNNGNWIRDLLSDLIGALEAWIRISAGAPDSVDGGGPARFGLMQHGCDNRRFHGMRPRRSSDAWIGPDRATAND